MIARHCPQALNILDRFHMVAKLNKALDEVRAGEARRVIREGYEPVLKKKRWCLLKRPGPCAPTASYCLTTAAVGTHPRRPVSHAMRLTMRIIRAAAAPSPWP